jgi:S1-C subfamily serine protease
VKLGHRAAVFERKSRNQLMSGSTSRRRVGFSEIIQHDIPLEAEFMGGPVLGLNGKALGINIARANRAETYLLPSEEVLVSIERILAQQLDADE